ncbi:MAG: hypothetical protein KKB21_02735 [Nanoarchaeota archaeon]|nr:hypothetical protein [Nanoarchaeota archaeon]MBU4086471.1 hypothetical protein [Nanoarchaeota archaeon]
MRLTKSRSTIRAQVERDFNVSLKRRSIHPEYYKPDRRYEIPRDLYQEKYQENILTQLVKITETLSMGGFN